MLQDVGAAALAVRRAGSHDGVLRLLGCLAQQTVASNGPCRAISAQAVAIDAEQLQSQSATEHSSDAAPAAHATSGASTSSQPVTVTDDSTDHKVKINQYGWAPNTFHTRLMQEIGLWMPKWEFSKLSKQQQQEVQQLQQRHKQRMHQLCHWPSGCMTADASNRKQLQVFVWPVADPAAAATPSNATVGLISSQAGQDSSSSSSSKQIRAYTTAQGDSATVPVQSSAMTAVAQPAAGSSTADNGSKLSQQLKQHRQHKQQQKGQADRQQQQLEQHQQQLVTSVPSVKIPMLPFITQPALHDGMLMRSNQSNLVVNLNTQLRNAYADNDHNEVVRLFDAFMDKGLRSSSSGSQAATAAANEDAPRSTGAAEVSSTGAARRAHLANEYRPDYDTLAVYCKSSIWLAEQHARRRDKSDSLVPQQLSHRAERAAALWGDRGLRGPGVQVYHALLAAYQFKNARKALELFHHLRQIAPPEDINRHYKLNMQGISCAIAVGDFPAADEYGRLFSNHIVPFSVRDYSMRVQWLFRMLAKGAAATGNWDKAIYWLQQLINNDEWHPVDDADFLGVMFAAADAGRMDVVRVMMSAVDAQRKAKNQPPIRYKEKELLKIMEAAAKASDTALIDTAWQRLLADLAPAHSSSNSNDDAAGGGSSDKSSSSKHPSKEGYQMAIKSYVTCGQYGTAFDHVAELESIYKGSADACSVYQGLGFFPEMLDTEERLAAAFAQLKTRQEQQKAVTTTMMNVVARAIARLGNTEATGKVFDSYGVWGLSPDADSYNTVIESCAAAKKLAAVEGLISYMASKGIQPNAASWNLLMQTALKIGDLKAAASVVDRMKGAAAALQDRVARRGFQIARDQGNIRMKLVFAEIILQSNRLSQIERERLQGFVDRERMRSHQQQQQDRSSNNDDGSSSRSNDNGSSQGQRRTYDAWRPGQPSQNGGQRHQQPQQQLEQQFELQQKQQQQHRGNGRHEDSWRATDLDQQQQVSGSSLSKGLMEALGSS